MSHAIYEPAADQRPGVILVGASVRAAAFSALRAGFQPWCVDLFADEDLCAVAPCRRAHRYPQGLLDAATTAPAGWPLLYTGALENWPDLVAQLGELRPLWGNPPRVLQLVRSPETLLELCRAYSLPCPLVVAGGPGPKGGRRWLIKPRRGAGGTGIRFFARGDRIKKGEYLQEWIDGMPCSALCLGKRDGACRVLGVTRQLIAVDWLNAGPFKYCGTIGPWPVNEPQRRNVEKLAQLLVADLGVRGVFGIDGILTADAFWPVEVNPRYTASVEILEHALVCNILALHAQAFGHGSDASSVARAAASARVCAKGILFAPTAMRFEPTEHLLANPVPNVFRLPAVADLPRASALLRKGQPILTVFAEAESLDACLGNLKSKVTQLVQKICKISWIPKLQS